MTKVFMNDLLHPCPVAVDILLSAEGKCIGVDRRVFFLMLKDE